MHRQQEIKHPALLPVAVWQGKENCRNQHIFCVAGDARTAIAEVGQRPSDYNKNWYEKRVMRALTLTEEL